MANGLEAKGPVSWLNQITQDLNPDLSPDECRQQLVREVGQRHAFLPAHSDSLKGKITNLTT